MSEPPLPDVYQADLDPPTLAALLTDLEAHAQVLRVRLKAGSERHADPDGVSLVEAAALLSAGRVRGVQIDYRHDGALWTDTLIRTPAGVRLVRMESPLSGG